MINPTTDTAHLGDSCSDAAWSAWAKSGFDRRTPTESEHWLPLLQHLDDTAAVAGLLWDDWVPPSIRQHLEQSFGVRAREVYVWLAAVHDSGKISAAFAVMDPEMLNRMGSFGLVAEPGLRDDPRRAEARHERVGYLAAQSWLRANEVSVRVSNALASVVAAHHGRAPLHAELEISRQPRFAGDIAWTRTRDEVFSAATKRYLTDGVDGLRALDAAPIQSLVLLSGLVIIADWIASSDLFPLWSRSQTRPRESTEARADHAWAELALPKHWRPAVPMESAAELLAERFDLPATASPYPMQRELIELARNAPAPALMIVESEMGSGKTEGALAAGEIMAGRFGLSGVFFGLPTQATADGMFARFLRWANRLELETPSSVFLAHGRSLLNEEFNRLRREMWRTAETGHGNDDGVVAHRWFGDPKRGPLADFVVGTIDQALFAALQSRHVMLRHLALTSKVVILDEIHSYSAYTGRYLERLTHWLGCYGVPVIMLSATLPPKRRASLLQAYERGRAHGCPAVEIEASASAVALDKIEQDPAYPLISIAGDGQTARSLHPDGSGISHRIRLERVSDGDEALIAVLEEALTEGGCAAVVRNTVNRVQQTARLLRERFPDTEVIVAHSRFIGIDRAARDRQLLELFGPPSPDRNRPRNAIVVASQVVEQSLDIDFDLMVSDLAPIDLLLQRAGRLHRHRRGLDESDRPAPLREARLVLTGVDWTTMPPSPKHDYDLIYLRSIQLRTLAALDGRERILLPDDIAPLVRTVYDDAAVGPPGWQELLSREFAEASEKLEQQRADADAFLLDEPRSRRESNLVGWSARTAGDPTLDAYARAAVRDGEDNIEMLLLQLDDSGRVRTPDWLPPDAGGRPRAALEISLNELPDIALTHTLLGCSIRLPTWISKGATGDAVVDQLERLRTALDLQTWHRSPALKGELAFAIGPDRRGRLIGFELRYDPDNGLEVIR